MLKARIITACILLLLFLPALFFLHPLGWTILVVAIVMLGVSEWSRLAGISGKYSHIYWWITLGMLLSIIWFDFQPTRQPWLSHIPAYAVSSIFWLIVVPLWLGLRWQIRQPLLLALVGWVLLIPTGLAMMDLRAYNPWLLLGLLGLVWIADIAAYFVGSRFGKRRLAPGISPGKSWEGVAGAILGVTAYVFFFAWGSGLLSVRAVLPSLLLVSWLGVALAVMGDLFESAIKRQAGVKDSGNLLPGHGGLLDRIDALTATLPLAAMIIFFLRLP